MEARKLGLENEFTMIYHTSDKDTRNNTSIVFFVCFRHFAVTACLVPICNVHGCAVTTVEGIGSTKNKVHAIQV